MAALKPISQQTVVITGASSGIGLATARRAANSGAAVVLVARNKAALEEIVAELRVDGCRAEACAIDIADDGCGEKVANVASQSFGGFDLWVNCASVSSYGTLEQLGVNEQRRVFDVDYFGMLQASLTAVAHLRRRGGGAIINVGSILSDRAVIEQPAYSAAKAAVRALTENLRMDVERQGLPISVTLIKPSGVHTPFPEHARNHMSDAPRIPQVIYAPELVADAIIFAAQHPRRQINVGGTGFLLSSLARLFPRATDRIMEAAFVEAQQDDVQRGDPAARDNLFEPKSDGRRRNPGLLCETLKLLPPSSKTPGGSRGPYCRADWLGIAQEAEGRSGNEIIKPASNSAVTGGEMEWRLFPKRCRRTRSAAIRTPQSHYIGLP